MESLALVELLFHPICSTAFILFLVFLLQKWLKSSISDQSSPPSPPKIPIFGHLLNLGSLPHITLQAYARRHGPLFLLHIGSKPTIVASSAEMAREIMKTHDLIFADRPKSSISDKLLYDSRDIAASPCGEYWRQMKSIAVLHLLSNKRVHSFRSVREEEVKLMIQNIRQNPASVNLSHEFSRLTNDVICRVALGRKYGAVAGEDKFRDILPQFVKLLGSFSVRDFVPWLGWIDGISGMDAKAKKVAKELDDFVDRVIQDHVHADYNPEEQSQDLVDVLLSIQRQDSIGFPPLEMKSIKALILDMFAGGTDTIYTVLEWTMSELLRHPEAMKKLQSEVKEVAGEKEYVSEDDLEKMHYLKAVIKETLRLHPPIPLLVPRECIQDVKLKGYHIKRGTLVMINAWAIGRDPQVWGSDAEEFQPNRFINSGIDFKGHDFELIPFGAGRRGCPGVLFATIIGEIALANAVCKFEWTLPGGTDAKSLDMTMASGLTIHRRFPLVAVATPC
ncbi:cytochrome P450 71A24-like [Momordica charantia]|uniref:Cytochrome P450 71A24-like n=1 Tax=Momordica charantia TaxID=3673 RepID=A0A6J1BYV5_MOMCH|nr:cytochrome P450 71A24-like [Momordica charantia]